MTPDNVEMIEIPPDQFRAIVDVVSQPALAIDNSILRAFGSTAELKNVVLRKGRIRHSLAHERHEPHDQPAGAYQPEQLVELIRKDFSATNLAQRHRLVD